MLKCKVQKIALELLRTVFMIMQGDCSLKSLTILVDIVNNILLYILNMVLLEVSFVEVQYSTIGY